MISSYILPLIVLIIFVYSYKKVNASSVKCLNWSQRVKNRTFLGKMRKFLAFIGVYGIIIV